MTYFYDESKSIAYGNIVQIFQYLLDRDRDLLAALVPTNDHEAVYPIVHHVGKSAGTGWSQSQPREGTHWFDLLMLADSLNNICTFASSELIWEMDTYDDESLLSALVMALLLFDPLKILPIGRRTALHQITN